MRLRVCKGVMRLRVVMCLHDYQKVQHLALHAFHNTENEAV